MTPIEHIVPYAALTTLYLDFALEVTEKKVELHKRRFGRQSYCLNLSRRVWVWEFDRYRVLVNNAYGFSFEMAPGVSAEEALTLYENHFKLLRESKA
jgi:hypothetical protein